MRQPFLLFTAPLLMLAFTGSAFAATVSDEFYKAADKGLISQDDAIQALSDYKDLAAAPDRDFVFQRQQIDSLAKRGRLVSRAGQVVPSLRVYASQGDKANGTRVAVGAIIVQRIPGAGWQVHPLASAGKLNAWAGSSSAKSERLEEAGRQLAKISTAGQTRYEYLFPWLGSRPGWISAMPQAILASAYARIYKRSGDQYFRKLALAALRPLYKAPPKGTTLALSNGSHGLLYPFRPNFRVANAQLWTTLSVDDVGEITDSLAAQRLAEGLARQSLSEISDYADPKRAGWTLYAIGSDKLAGKSAPENYHYLTVQALRRLCSRGRDQFCPWARKYGGNVPSLFKSFTSKSFASKGFTKGYQ